MSKIELIVNSPQANFSCITYLDDYPNTRKQQERGFWSHTDLGSNADSGSCWLSYLICSFPNWQDWDPVSRGLWESDSIRLSRPQTREGRQAYFLLLQQHGMLRAASQRGGQTCSGPHLGSRDDPEPCSVWRGYLTILRDGVAVETHLSELLSSMYSNPPPTRLCPVEQREADSCCRMPWHPWWAGFQD